MASAYCAGGAAIHIDGTTGASCDGGAEDGDRLREAIAAIQAAPCDVRGTRKGRSGSDGTRLSLTTAKRRAKRTCSRGFIGPATG